MCDQPSCAGFGTGKWRVYSRGSDQTAICDERVLSARSPIPEAAQQILEWMTPGVRFSYIVASLTCGTGGGYGTFGRRAFPAVRADWTCKADDRRVPGWQALHSYLLLHTDEQGGTAPGCKCSQTALI